MSTAMAAREESAVLPKEQIDLIRRTVANGATNDELALFLYDCQRRGVHPLDKLLHFTKRGGRYTPVTSIDFMRSQAAMSGEMAGSDDPVFMMNPAREGLESATVTVYRITQGQRFAYTATARWAEYCPDNAPMWKRMPHTMLGKCAEALALRKAFPQQLAGLYSREEMDQADKPSGYVVDAPAPPGVRENAAAPPAGELRGTSASSSNGRTAAFEAGDVGSSPADAASPDLGVDLPAGSRLIVKVESTNVGAAKGRIYFNAEVEGGRCDVLTFKDQIVGLATELCQTREPCFPELKKSASGNWRVESLMRVPPGYDPPKGLPAKSFSDADIPF